MAQQDNAKEEQQGTANEEQQDNAMEALCEDPHWPGFADVCIGGDMTMVKIPLGSEVWAVFNGKPYMTIAGRHPKKGWKKSDTTNWAMTPMRPSANSKPKTVEALSKQQDELLEDWEVLKDALCDISSRSGSRSRSGTRSRSRSRGQDIGNPQPSSSEDKD